MFDFLSTSPTHHDDRVGVFFKRFSRGFLRAALQRDLARHQGVGPVFHVQREEKIVILNRI